MSQITLSAFSGAFIGKAQQLELGDRIILPTTVLASALGNGANSLGGPMLFQIINPKNDLSIHCGVLEFTSTPGKLYLPFWMMKFLALEEGTKIRLKKADIPKGTFVRLQPLDRAFQKIDRPKEILESIFRRFATLTQDSTISVAYHNKNFRLKVLQTKPDTAISIINTDLSVDFAPHPDDVKAFAEEASKQRAQNNPAFNLSGGDDDDSDTNSDDDSDDNEEPGNYWETFTGAGRKVDTSGQQTSNLHRKLGTDQKRVNSSFHKPLSPPRHLSANDPDESLLSTSLQSQGTMLYHNMRQNATSPQISSSSLTSSSSTSLNSSVDLNFVCLNCHQQFETEKQVGLHETQCTRSTLRCNLCGDSFTRQHPLDRGQLRIRIKQYPGFRKHPVTFWDSLTQRPDPATNPFFNDQSLLDHLETVHKIVTCEYCDKKMEVADLIAHQTKYCKNRPLLCEFCGVGVKPANYSDHRAYCGSRTEKCQKCEKYITLKEMAVHLSSNCKLGHTKKRKPFQGIKSAAAESITICPFCQTPFTDLQLMFVHAMSDCPTVPRTPTGEIDPDILAGLDPAALLTQVGGDFSKPSPSISGPIPGSVKIRKNAFAELNSQLKAKTKPKKPIEPISLMSDDDTFDYDNGTDGTSSDEDDEDDEDEDVDDVDDADEEDVVSSHKPKSAPSKASSQPSTEVSSPLFSPSVSPPPKPQLKASNLSSLLINSPDAPSPIKFPPKPQFDGGFYRSREIDDQTALDLALAASLIDAQPKPSPAESPSDTLQDESQAPPQPNKAIEEKKAQDSTSSPPPEKS